MELLIALALAQSGSASIEPQPLADGVADSGINVLLDQSHAMSFFWHWDVQDSLRGAGHRVSCSQASLHRVLAPGSRANVRDQSAHRFPDEGEAPPYRPMVEIAVPDYDVAILTGAGSPLPYLPEEVAALTSFVERGGGLIVFGHHVSGSTPLEALLEGLGARFLAAPATIAPQAEIPGVGPEAAARRVASVGPEWTVRLGNGPAEAVVATRAWGAGVVVLVAEEGLCVLKGERGWDAPNAPFLSWCVETAAGDRPRRRDDERRVPWEHAGIGGVYYPENSLPMGGLTVYYADNQLRTLVEAAEGGFADVRDTLAAILPTPPNPGNDMYIILAGGDGGGWAENVYVPKVAGTIATELVWVKSILAHELAHTMYGPEAVDGTAGCGMPEWWSEAHAGFFQRKVMWKLGEGDTGPYWDVAGIMSWDPLLDAVDLAHIGEGEMGRAWTKVWFLWRLMDSRYGEGWYPAWLAYVHRKYAAGPPRTLTMDEYIMSLSESLGEDVAPLFERFGTTVGQRTDLPPIAPRR